MNLWSREKEPERLEILILDSLGGIICKMKYCMRIGIKCGSMNTSDFIWCNIQCASCTVLTPSL
jgi:hypothetical protein